MVNITTEKPIRWRCSRAISSWNFRKGLTVKKYFSCIRLQQADDVFEQDTFTGAAFSHDGCHLPLKNSQADAPQHRVGAELFKDTVKLDDGS
jgi:hypothetical protein